MFGFEDMALQPEPDFLQEFVKYDSWRIGDWENVVRKKEGGEMGSIEDQQDGLLAYIEENKDS